MIIVDGRTRPGGGALTPVHARGPGLPEGVHGGPGRTGEGRSRTGGQGHCRGYRSQLDAGICASS